MRLLVFAPLCWLACVGPAQALDIAISVGAVELPQRPKIRDVSLNCSIATQQGQTVCRNGTLTATLPELGKVSATLNASTNSTQHWQAQASLERNNDSLSSLQKFAVLYGLVWPGTAQGSTNLRAVVSATSQGTNAQIQLDLHQVDYNEPSGRYASEKWDAQLALNWNGSAQRGTIQLESHSGQLYVEPLFIDFSALPTTLNFEASTLAKGWRIDALRLRQGKAGTLTGTAQLDERYQLQQMAIKLVATSLKPLIATNVQPYLIGTQVEGLEADGTLDAELQWADGHAASAVLRPVQVSIQVPKLGLSLHNIAGDVSWSAAQRKPSTLRWDAGTAQKITLGPTQMRFITQARDFDLLQPTRIPLLDGALEIDRLTLHQLGDDALQANFSGELQPIDLAALCKALGWPEFGGTLSGKLPGLRIRDNVWKMDGTLEADAFGGHIELGQLRAIDPFGVLPRISTDIRLRRLDLEKLTQVFSFGRITGRLDGDITGLRLLAWKPVAFDGRLYSTPDDDKPHRISQRAIDNISSIGGGPTGVLSRGFLSLFEDFAYNRMGLGCILRDGRCRMSGIETVADANGYTIVEGRLLPRIDVKGFANNVSWNNLLSQLDAARKSSGPQTQSP